jgi:hypothetical protein
MEEWRAHGLLVVYLKIYRVAAPLAMATKPGKIPLLMTVETLSPIICDGWIKS